MVADLFGVIETCIRGPGAHILGGGPPKFFQGQLEVARHVWWKFQENPLVEFVSDRIWIFRGFPHSKCIGLKYVWKYYRRSRDENSLTFSMIGVGFTEQRRI